jgi:Tol biopolymer transport system component
MRSSYLPLLGLLAIGCAPDATTGVLTPAVLSAAGANHLLPTYSPDGSRVAGWQTTGGEFELWIADGDLSNLTMQGLISPGVVPIVWSSDGTRLAVPRPGSTTWSIVTIPAAGGDATPIYSGPGLMYPTSWSADGSKLLILNTQAGGTYTMQVVDIETGTAEPLLSGEQRAHIGYFAPVGQHAVVNVFDSARVTLWAVDSLGAAPRQLTTEGYESPPNIGGGVFWSPDGRELVFESTRTGAPDLWVLDYTTGTTRQLTNDLRADRRPSWSPDGEWILFESERGRQTDLWVVPAKGGDAIRLTDDAAIEAALGWRGPSQHVAYTVVGGSGSIHTVPVAGGAEQQLSPDSVRVDYFEVSPDGSQIAFTSRRTGSALDIWVMPSGGGEARLVASPQTVETRVFWSSDGSTLAFLGLGGGTPDPWTLDVATGALQQVLTWNSVEYDVVWGASSAELLVLSDRDSRFSDVWRVPLDGGEPVRLTTDGRVNGFLGTLDGGTRVLVAMLGGAGGRIGLGEVQPDGTVRTITDAQSVWAVAWNTPAGSDSVAANLDGDDGENVSVMMSLADGGFRPLGPPGSRTNYWSRSGGLIAYSVGGEAGRAIGVADLSAGTLRTISSGAGLDVGAEFLPGDSVVVFRRSRPESRIATLDLAELLARAR